MIAFLFFLLSPVLCQGIVLESTNVPRFIAANLFLLIGFGYFFYKTARVELPNLTIILILLGFYLIHLLSILWSFNAPDALFESQKIFLGIVTILCFYQLIKTQKKTVLFATLISGLFFSLYSFYEYWRLPKLNGSIQFSLSGHENLLSSFAFLFLPFSFYAFTEKDKSTKILGLLTATSLLVLILLVQVRSVYLALFISTVFFLMVMGIMNQRKKLRRLVIGSFAGLLLVGGILMLFGNNLNTKGTFSGNETSSLKERFLLWDKTEKLIYENPIAGVGAGNWQYNYSKFGVEDIDKSNFYNTFFKRPHNDFLWVISETGLIGFLLLFALVIFIGKRALAHIFETKNYKTLILISALLGLMVISFFSFPRERISHICITGLLLAFLLKEIPFFDSGKIMNKKWLLILLPTGLLFNLTIGYYRFSGEYYTQLSIYYQNQNNPQLAIENGKNALSPFYQCDPVSRPVYSYIGWGYSITNETESLLEMSEKAYQLSPFDYKVLDNYGVALMRVFENSKAKVVLKEAYRINPNYESVNFNLSVLAFNSGDYMEALEWIQKIPDYQIKYKSNLERIQQKISESTNPH